jgi:hypothetical protein
MFIDRDELERLHAKYPGKPMFMVPPTDEFKRMFDVALEAD